MSEKNKASEKDELFVNLYDVLEISPRASEEVITAAHDVLAKKYSSKKRANKTAVISLNEAKDTLLDKVKREEYDKKREDLKGSVIGNYRVLELIAEGGFGKTYKGEHVTLKAPVCIKHGHYVSPQDEKILLEEAKSIWDLRHYGIPTMRDILKIDDGSLAIVMSYIPGKTLGKIVEKAGKLDVEHVSWITERTLNVLKYLHFNGVVHGDVKPQNIIIQPESHNLVLVDYGLSLIRPTKESKSVGYTPYFASPEQEKGNPLLPESDFYSLGMTMIYALGGDIERKKVPQSTPEPLCDFIKKLLVKDVLYRPNWEKEDLFETISELRLKMFGRKHSGMKKLEVS